MKTVTVYCSIVSWWTLSWFCLQSCYPKAIYSTDHYQTQRAFVLWLPKNIFTSPEHAYKMLHWTKEEQTDASDVWPFMAIFRKPIRSIFIKWQQRNKMYLSLAQNLVAEIVSVLWRLQSVYFHDLARSDLINSKLYVDKVQLRNSNVQYR